MLFTKFQIPKTTTGWGKKNKKEQPPTSLLCKPGITATKLLRGEASLGIIRAVSREEGKLGLNDVEPHVGIQRILCLGEQGWLRAQELLVGCRCRRSLLLASTMLLGVGLALQELSQNLILVGHPPVHWGSGRRWGGGDLLIMPATLPSCHLKTENVASVIPTYNFERQAIISYGRKFAIIIILSSKEDNMVTNIPQISKVLNGYIN
jgi:hypothetical protein